MVLLLRNRTCSRKPISASRTNTKAQERLFMQLERTLAEQRDKFAKIIPDGDSAIMEGHIDWVGGLSRLPAAGKPQRINTTERNSS
jgi:hypothetical protein